jgi:hypothetical protein
VQLVDVAPYRRRRHAEALLQVADRRKRRFAQQVGNSSRWRSESFKQGLHWRFSQDGQTAADLEALRRTEGREAPKVLIVRGKGVLLSNSLTAGGEVMARCLAEVAGRIIAGERVAYLTPDDEYELTHWEAEIYRQALDRKSAGQPA